MVTIGRRTIHLGLLPPVRGGVPILELYRFGVRNALSHKFEVGNGIPLCTPVSGVQGHRRG